MSPLQGSFPWPSYSISCPCNVILEYTTLSQSLELSHFYSQAGQTGNSMGNYNILSEGQGHICLYPGAQNSLNTKEGHAFRAIFFPKMISFCKNTKHISVFKIAIWTWSLNGIHLKTSGRSVIFPFLFRALACHLWGRVNELQQMVITTPQVSSQ